ncbi:GTPase IMAP family member 7-like [Acanthochromis polyacanthus]|uniref:GTPase IMAP family member 7-like n=1 Tax=Acanthochromis polyacanthus TaxID=80966 RepID=UPI0022343975|nr:GTPase IMAP family member 7-like [Acanthochromis polyacanthus]
MGSGKSSTVNSILDRKVFDLKIGSTSVTQRCRRVGGEFRGRQLMLLDTPGLVNTHQTPREVQKELRRIVSLLFPGPHAFLIVIQIGRFTQEDRDAVRWIKEAMDSHALSFSVVVFTHGDHLDGGATVKQCLIDGCGDLAELVARCGGRYCVFNNQNSKNREQVSELLALVDGMMQANEESCYTSKLLHKAEEDLCHQLQEEKEEVFKKKQEYKRKVKTAQLKCKSEMEELKKNQELEKEKVEKLARDQEGTFRQEKEENDRKEEEDKREVLIKFEKLTKKLEEHVEREVEMRRSIEEKIQKDKAENEKTVKEKELEHIQREQAIRQREEMKRDALQKDLDKLIQRLEEQSRKKKQMEETFRHEREENQRERYLQMENQRAEKRQTVALQQELQLIKMEVEKQKVTEESIKSQLEDNLRRGREKCDEEEMSALKKPCDKKCLDTIVKTPAEKHSTTTAVTGYVQEMGLLGLNVALESIGAPCSIQ